MTNQDTNALWEILGDEREPVARDIADALNQPNRETSRAFAACFAGLSPERRREIIDVLANVAEDEFQYDFGAIFRQCLRDGDGAVRRRAIQGLWEDEQVDLLRSFIQLLAHDPEPLVRAAAATALGKYVWLEVMEEIDERYAKQVREALFAVAQNRSEDIEVSRRAIESLGWLNGEPIRRLIDYAYAHGDPRMKVSALLAMGRNAESVWEETVLGDLDDPSVEIRYEAIRATGEMHLARAVTPLIQALGDRDREVQEVAIWSLGEIGGDRAQRALDRLVQGDDEELAAAAEEAIDNMLLGEEALDLLAIDTDEDELDEDEADEADDEQDEGDDDEDEDEESDKGEWPDEFLDVR